MPETRSYGPEIAGRCPACKGAALFVGVGGHVTCARLDCPSPTAADDALREAGYAFVRSTELADLRARAEKAEAITNALTWLIAAGVQVTIGACDHQGGAELRVAVDLDDNPAWYGDLSDSLADAKTYRSAQGVEP